MEEDNKRLVDSLNKTINSSYTCVLKNICDSPIADLIDLETFKGVPFLRCAISTYSICKSIKEVHHLKKISKFLLELEKGLNDEKREKYKNSLIQSEEKRQKEIEYIIVILERYLEINKAEILAKLYLAYLDNEIDWAHFCSFSASLDRIMEEDIRMLLSGSYFVTSKTSDLFASVSRLEACGFIYQEPQKLELNDSFEIVNSVLGSSRFASTMYGSIFINCLRKYN